jgi:hypothetical protein
MSVIRFFKYFPEVTSILNAMENNHKRIQIAIKITKSNMCQIRFSYRIFSYLKKGQHVEFENQPAKSSLFHTILTSQDTHGYIIFEKYMH